MRRSEEEHRRWMRRSEEEDPEEFLKAEYLEESSFATPLMISEVLVTSPPIEKVVCFSASVPVPQKTVAIPIVLSPIQQVKSLRIASPTKIATPPVSSRPTPTSNFSFFWDPKAEEAEKVALESTPQVENLSASVPNQVSISQVATVPIQEVSILQASTPMLVSGVSITSAPVQRISTLCAASPIPIVKTSVAKVPTDLIFSSFTPKMIVTSLRNTSSLQSSPFGFKENRQFPVHKSKVTPHRKKPQFSGTCVNKSRQLRPKVRFVGSGWKRMREKLVSVRKRKTSARKDESLGFAKSPPCKNSWKHRKKKTVHFRRSVLKEDVTWKRKMKRSLYKFDPDSRSSHLRKSRTWKQRKKKDRCSKRLYDEFDWDPGNATLLKIPGKPAVFRPGVCERMAFKRINGFINILH